MFLIPNQKHQRKYLLNKFCKPKDLSYLIVMPHIVTPVIRTKAKHNRTAYMTITDNQVNFDCSDGEYGSVTVSLAQLEEAIYEHKIKLKNENKTATQSRRD